MKNNLFKKSIVYTLILGELLSTTNVYALSKDETVYVRMNNDGKSNITVSEHLYDFKDNKINDKTTLNDIKNLNGDEKYQRDGNNIVWENKGEEIYYQGMLDKDLPISVSAKYYLDGKEMTSHDMLGKKGKVKILLNYQNKASKYMNINGKMEKMYTPFMIVTTSIINNTDNKNIKVNNGRVVDNGLTSIVVGLSSPGLYESLKLDELKKMNSVEITYDTNNFSLNSIYSLASCNLFQDNNLDLFGNLGTIYKNINLLQSNMDTLVKAGNELSKGSSDINKGINTLNGKIQELNKKYQYYRGQDENTLKEKLIEIIKKNLQEVIPVLENDIKEETARIIKNNKEVLAESVVSFTKKNTKDIFDNELKNVVGNLDFNKLLEQLLKTNFYNTLTNDNDLKGITNLLKDELNKELKGIIDNTTKEILSSVKVDMTDEEKKLYITSLANKYGVSLDVAAGMLNDISTDTVNGIKKSLSNINISDKIISNLNNKDYLKGLVNNYVNEVTNKLRSILGNDENIKNYENTLKDKILSAIKSDLNNEDLFMNQDLGNTINQMIDKIIDNTAKDLANRYTEEYFTEIVSNVMNKEFNPKTMDNKLRLIIDNYKDELGNKLLIIDETVKSLTEALNMLDDGSYKLSTGMKEFSVGLDKYNKEGINKLVKTVNGDIKSLAKRIEALEKLSNEYKLLDLSSNNTKTNSKIIFMIDGETLKEEKEQVEEIPENKNLWDKIKGLFN